MKEKVGSIIAGAMRLRTTDTYGEGLIKGATFGFGIAWIVGTVMDITEKKSKSIKW